MRLHFVRLFFAATLSVVLAGCSSMPEMPTFGSGEPEKPIRKIALLGPAEPETYTVDVWNVGMFIGRITTLPIGSTQAADSQAFSQALKGQGFNISERLRSTLIQAFKERGIEVVPVQKALARNEEGVLVVEEEIKSAGFDAIMNLSLDSAGYIAQRTELAYHPFLAAIAQVRTVEKANAIFPTYRKRQTYGFEAFTTGGGAALPAPEKYVYPEKQGILARAAEAGEGLYVGADLIARKLAEDFAASR